MSSSHMAEPRVWQIDPNTVYWQDSTFQWNTGGGGWGSISSEGLIPPNCAASGARLGPNSLGTELGQKNQIG